MKANPIGLHGIWKAWIYERITQLSYIGFAKPTLMKGIPPGLHMIGKACTYERYPNWVT